MCERFRLYDWMKFDDLHLFSSYEGSERDKSEDFFFAFEDYV